MKMTQIADRNLVILLLQKMESEQKLIVNELHSKYEQIRKKAKQHPTVENESKLREFEISIHNRLDSLRKEQQKRLEDAGVAGFQVTNNEDEIADQMWTLAPYLHQMRGN